MEKRYDEQTEVGETWPLMATAERWLWEHKGLASTTSILPNNSNQEEQLVAPGLGRLVLAHQLLMLYVETRPAVVHRRAAVQTPEDVCRFLEAHVAPALTLNQCSRAEDALMAGLRERFRERIRDLLRDAHDAASSAYREEVVVLERARANLSHVAITVALQEEIMHSPFWLQQ